MKSPVKYLLFIILISALLLGSCMNKSKTSEVETNTDIENLNFTAVEAPEWTALFNRTTGWFGADGIFAIPLNGKDNETADSDTETMLIFSDTMVGEIRDNKLQPGRVMVNNTVAYIKGSEPKEGNISFHWAKNESDKPISLFSPQTPSAEPGDYYWLGDGFINTELDNTIYIFAYRMRNMDKSEDWSFKEMGTNLIAIPAGSTPPFKDQRQIETPLRFENGGFGAGIYVNTEKAGAPEPDGFIYTYGVRGKEKNLMVARVLPEEFENFNSWRFWDGNDWIEDMERVAYVTQDVSNELSVSALPDGRYALVFTISGINPIVGLRLGQSPYGPFGPIINVWESSEMKQKNYITYNAKAHPNLSAPGELLISYNVNAFDFRNEIEANPNLYRPRFIKLKLNQ
ncbi:hypothetical protein BH23BAC1_BH23BAC1_21990 [soil metagenome]